MSWRLFGSAATSFSLVVKTTQLPSSDRLPWSFWKAPLPPGGPVLTRWIWLAWAAAGIAAAAARRTAARRLVTSVRRLSMRADSLGLGALASCARAVLRRALGRSCVLRVDEPAVVLRDDWVRCGGASLRRVLAASCPVCGGLEGRCDGRRGGRRAVGGWAEGRGA